MVRIATSHAGMPHSLFSQQRDGGFSSDGRERSVIDSGNVVPHGLRCARGYCAPRICPFAWPQD